MSERNQFRHQQYGLRPAPELYELGQAGPALTPDTPEFARLLAAAGARYRAAGVREVHLLHGTFVGDDPLGWLRSVLAWSPALQARARGTQKRFADRIVKENGNYPPQLAERLARGIGIPVKRFVWTSENDHLGRAGAAVRWIDDLARASWSAGDRVLAWGHSHGGNVLALASNLLAADAAARVDFFETCRAFVREPAERPGPWRRVRALLESADARARLPQLDVATFGTPIRYGWDRAGCARLLHFVHHHPRRDLEVYRAALPRSLSAILTAADGDYVQHLGVAGTNFPPFVLAFRSWISERRLARFLAPHLRFRDVFRRLKAGTRVADTGHTLLLDYGPNVEAFPWNVAGHAVYTRSRWLPFHARTVAERFYR